MENASHSLTPSQNRALNAEELAARATVVRSRPLVLDFETSATCNLRCVMCNLVTQGGSGRTGFMAPEVVETVKPLLPFADYIALHGLGEPLLSPSFYQILECLDVTDQCFSEVNTNGLLLTEERALLILDSPLSRINFSIDAATKETFSFIRGGDFELLLENIRRLIELRRQRETQRPLVNIHMTLMVANIQELPALIELACDLGVDSFSALHLLRGVTNNWTVERSGRIFDYQQQHLSAQPSLSNEMVRQAFAIAAAGSLEMFTPEADLMLPE
jgi:MoaA/NifB/PqqE/SkfB family radical SAM enzyme